MKKKNTADSIYAGWPIPLQTKTLTKSIHWLHWCIILNSADLRGIEQNWLSDFLVQKSVLKQTTWIMPNSWANCGGYSRFIRKSLLPQKPLLYGIAHCWIPHSAMLSNVRTNCTITLRCHGCDFLQISHDFALMPVGSSVNSTSATDFADTVYGSPGFVDSWYSVFPVSQQPAWTGRHPVDHFRLNFKCAQASDLYHILLRGLQVLETVVNLFLIHRLCTSCWETFCFFSVSSLDVALKIHVASSIQPQSINQYSFNKSMAERSL